MYVCTAAVVQPREFHRAFERKCENRAKTARYYFDGPVSMDKNAYYWCPSRDACYGKGIIYIFLGLSLEEINKPLSQQPFLSNHVPGRLRTISPTHNPMGYCTFLNQILSNTRRDPHIQW